MYSCPYCQVVVQAVRQLECSIVGVCVRVVLVMEYAEVVLVLVVVGLVVVDCAVVSVVPM